MDAADRNKIYVDIIEALEKRYSPFEVARWFALGDESGSSIRNIRSSINRKTLSEDAKGKRNCTGADLMVAHLMKFIESGPASLGRLGKMRYGPGGRLLGLTVKPKEKTAWKVSQEEKNRVYVDVIERLEDEYGPFEVARWFTLGMESSSQVKSARSSINRKLLPDDAPGKRSATNADVVAVQLLAYLDHKGFDLSQISFRGDGRLAGIGKRPLSEGVRLTSELFPE